MARKPRVEFPRAFSHVIYRGNQRRTMSTMMLTGPAYSNYQLDE